MIDPGGVLETTAGTQMNFDSQSYFTIGGTVNNAGNISADWSVEFNVGSQFSNTGSFQNKQGATVRGAVDNHGYFGNTATNVSAGFFQQVATRFTNHVGATLLNHGQFEKFYATRQCRIDCK